MAEVVPSSCSVEVKLRHGQNLEQQIKSWINWINLNKVQTLDQQIKSLLTDKSSNQKLEIKIKTNRSQKLDE